MFDRHPNLRLVLVHGGGFLPYQTGRLDRESGGKGTLTDALDATGVDAATRKMVVRETACSLFRIGATVNA